MPKKMWHRANMFTNDRHFRGYDAQIISQNSDNIFFSKSFYASLKFSSLGLAQPDKWQANWRNKIVSDIFLNLRKHRVKNMFRQMTYKMPTRFKIKS